MSKYINPMTDFGFKYIFGREESKPFLIDFLNCLLHDEPEFDTIVDLVYLDKEKSRSRRKERGVIYDIHCTSSNGRQFTVEMQNSGQAYYIDRMIYYASKAIVDQGKTGPDWQYRYNPVYVVSFMNFVHDMFGDELRTDAALCDLKTKKPISDKLRYIFIQLPLFRKVSPEECVSDMDRWYYVFINMKNMETMPFTQENRLFSRLADMASYANLSPEDKLAYDADLKAYRDIMGQLSFAEARGIEKGIEKGRLAAVAEMVFKMDKEGIPIGQIARLVKMNVEEVGRMLGRSRAE